MFNNNNNLNANNQNNNSGGPGNLIPGSVINQNQQNNNFNSTPPPTDYSQMYINNLNPVDLTRQVNQPRQNEENLPYRKPSPYSRLIIFIILCLIIIAGIIYLVIILKP